MTRRESMKAFFESDQFTNVKFLILGPIIAVASWTEIIKIADVAVRLMAGIVGLIIGLISLKRLLKPEEKKTTRGTVALLALFALLLFSGCTYARKGLGRADAKTVANAQAIVEASAVMTTAGVDVLSLAPTNEYTSLALEFAKQDQLLEGMPQERIDVSALIAGNKAALKSLALRYDMQSRLIAEKAIAEAKQRDAETRLVEMGKLYEAERNKSIWKRAWHWSVGVFGLAGTFAILFFCPALIPIFTRTLAWVVTKIPALAKTLGVVATDAFAAVAKGIDDFKVKKPEAKEVLEASLSKTMDASHKALVRTVRPQIIRVS